MLSEDGILYNGHIYRLTGNRLECDGGRVETLSEPLDRLALADGVLYAITQKGEHWLMLSDILSNLSDAAVLSGASDNQTEIYRFAREVLNVNSAVACGILANIYAESSFNPHSQTLDTNGLISYGICQWNGGRFTALKNWCAQNDYDYTTLSGQLAYLQSELEGGESAAYKRIKSCADTGEGAYESAYNWARYFERCAARYYIGRAERAWRVYWTRYSGEVYTPPETSPYITAVSAPSGQLPSGRSFSLRGIIASSNGNLTRVRAYIREQTSGTAVRSYQRDWDRNSYDIRADGLDDAFVFGTLSDGEYLYTVEASANGQTLTLISTAFTIGTPDTPPDNPTPPDSPDNPPDTPDNPPDTPDNPPDTQTAIHDVIWIGNDVRADVVCVQDGASIWCAGYDANGKLLSLHTVTASASRTEYRFNLLDASAFTQDMSIPTDVFGGAETSDNGANSAETDSPDSGTNSAFLQAVNQIMQVKVFVLDDGFHPLCPEQYG